MEKIIGDWHTKVMLSEDEAKDICKMGDGEECCAFLVCGNDSFECIRMSYPANVSIFSRLKKGTIKEKGEGGWSGCAWQSKL